MDEKNNLREKIVENLNKMGTITPRTEKVNDIANKAESILDLIGDGASSPQEFFSDEEGPQQATPSAPREVAATAVEKALTALLPSTSSTVTEEGIEKSGIGLNSEGNFQNLVDKLKLNYASKDAGNTSSIMSKESLDIIDNTGRRIKK